MSLKNKVRRLKAIQVIIHEELAIKVIETGFVNPKLYQVSQETPYQYSDLSRLMTSSQVSSLLGVSEEDFIKTFEELTKENDELDVSDIDDSIFRPLDQNIINL